MFLTYPGKPYLRPAEGSFFCFFCFLLHLYCLGKKRKKQGKNPLQKMIYYDIMYNNYNNIIIYISINEEL